MKENSPPANDTARRTRFPVTGPPTKKFWKEYDSYTCTTQVSTTSRPPLLAAIKKHTGPLHIS